MLFRSHAVKQVLNAYIRRNFVERLGGNNNNPILASEFKVKENKRPSLEYYKNSCIIFFIPAAFTSMVILDKDAFQFSSTDLHSGYAFLQDLFENEFAYNVEKTTEYFIRKCIKAFIDDAILVPHPTLPDRYNLTSQGYRKLKQFAGFLKTYLESYWIVLNFFMRYPKNSMGTKQRLKKIESRGFLMYKRKEIERKEALSTINYKNAIDYFKAQGVTGSESDEKISFFSEEIQRYLNHLSL